MSINQLFKQDLKVINIGLESFTTPLAQMGVEHVQLNWKPSVAVDPKAVQIINQKKDAIEEANKEAIKKILNGRPAVVGLDLAINVVPGMRKNLILHSGPPVTWEKMCGPMRGGVMAALMYEGLAQTPEEAEKLAASGKIDFEPCHEHSTVGPMAGIVCASMPVWIVENQAYGNKAFCTLNEGLGKVLRYGAYAPEVITKLNWMRDVLYPTLKDAVKHLGTIDLKSMIAQALHMGDEVHNRNRAGTSLLYRAIAPAVIQTCDDRKRAADSLNFINGNDHFFLNLSMPASKCILDAAANIPNSSICVVMARNGTEFGVKLAGTGSQWFTGEALVPDALYFPGYTKADANPDIGDSSITETAGLGGFAIAASPAIVQFVGGSANDAINYTMQMYEITAAENNIFQIPSLDFRGTPTGIDVRKVIEKNTLPFIDTGVAHKNAGVGQVGAGVLSAPIDPFKKAFEGLANKLK